MIRLWLSNTSTLLFRVNFSLSLGFGYSKYFYTSLMQAYLNDKNPDMAMKILQEMIEKGINPDLPVYTTLINSFRLGRKL